MPPDLERAAALKDQGVACASQDLWEDAEVRFGWCRRLVHGPRLGADAAALADYPLTVDSTFKTCDDSIYAAGRHVAGQERFNSLELGACLAQSLLARLTDSSVEAPDFRKARAVSATLPGGLFYCRAALPTVPVDATALPTGMLGNDEVSWRCPFVFCLRASEVCCSSACERESRPLTDRHASRHRRGSSRRPKPYWRRAPACTRCATSRPRGTSTPY